MTRAILYYSQKDFEKEKLIEGLSSVCRKYSMEFIYLDIESISDDLSRTFKTTPNFVVGPYNLKYPFTMADAEIAISAASMRPDATKNINLKKAKNKNKLGLFLARFYPSVIALIILLFVGGAFMAPLQMVKGNVRTANSLYGFYRIFCHQLAFRSFFIQGDQLFYPRDLANINNVTTYEQEFNDNFDDIDFARSIVGNPEAGYKIALCERDLAIYLTLALIALIFQITGKKIKPEKWYFWVVIGLIPIALDGFSQIPGLSSGWPSWFPVRESTPILRIVTGALFGGMTGLYMFPLMEDSMKETYHQLLKQREIIKATLKENKSHA